VTKRQLFALTFSALLVGCTSLLGDFEVGPASTPTTTDSDGGDAAPPCTGPTCPCEGAQARCGDVCVDTQTSATNCGECGNACANGLVCEGGACKCPSGGNLCGGTCATATDRSKCGPSCQPCQDDEICVSTCKPAPAPEYLRQPLSPAGWTDGDGQPFAIRLKPTGIGGTIYECRTGPAGTFSNTTPAWGPCDGAGGTNPVHFPKETPGTPEGTYRTEYRYRIDTFRSPTITARLYMHHSLDRVPTCPRANQPGDGPAFTDAEIFGAVQLWANANQPPTFPVSGTFPLGSNPPDKNDPIHLLNPWIRIPFTQVSISSGAGNWGSYPTDYVMNERSLRHAYVMNQARNLVLMRRVYASPRTRDCQNRFPIGHPNAAAFGPLGRGPRYIDCKALVLNTRGNAVCVTANNATPPRPVVTPIDRRPLPDNPGTGTVTATNNSKVLTVTGYTWSSAWKDAHVYIAQAHPYVSSEHPGSPGRWYRIESVSSANTVVLAEAYKGPGGAGIGWRYRFAALVDDFDIPAGYMKLHQDGGHFYATGAAGYNPSKQTKCEIVGCTSPSTPWLTYLPP
jgi:hypothetical protein